MPFANSLYPDQAQQNVGPDLDPICLIHRLFTDFNHYFLPSELSGNSYIIFFLYIATASNISSDVSMLPLSKQ